MLDIAPGFTELSEFCSHSSGGKVLFSTDDFFATCENMIADSDPVWIQDKHTEFGKWMDGWETRRKRITGHDWCIIKLATKCVIRGLLVDTAYFTGNNAPKFSLQAACLTPEEESLIPERDSQMGTACAECDFEQMKRLRSDKWEEIVPVTALRPGYEDTRLNYQKVVNDEAWTHIRLNIFPDGGVARLRVFGEAKPDVLNQHSIIDLASMLHGGCCQGFSNAHYGHPRNVIKPGKSKMMTDGWETARNSNRPEIIDQNEDGTLRMPGQEWAVYKLGYIGTVKRICVDTSHFKGNYPDSVKIEATNLGTRDWTSENQAKWTTILNPSKLSAHKEHWFDCDSDSISHIRVTMAPDGGISRIRTFGFVSSIIN